MLVLIDAPRFLRHLYHALQDAPSGMLTWADLNALAAQYLPPTAEEHQSTWRAHAIVAYLIHAGLLSGTVTAGRNGAAFVEAVYAVRPQALAA